MLSTDLEVALDALLDGITIDEDDLEDEVETAQRAIIAGWRPRMWSP